MGRGFFQLLQSIFCFQDADLSLLSFHKQTKNQAGFSEENPAWFFVYETAVFAVLHLGSAGAGDGDAGAEWTQGKLCKLKALHPKGDPDDGDAEQQPVQRSGNGKGKSTEEQPQQVHQQRGRTAAVDDDLAKREKCQPCQLEALHPDGDADDGDAPQQPDQRPANTHPKSSKHKPEQIAK